MQKGSDIFFSYSHLDAEIATELAARLNDQGFSCFVAERDITATQQWEPRIREEIQNCKCVLVLLTPRSKDSTWVKIETGAAWVLEKDVVPASMFVEARDLPEPLSKYQLKKVETNSQVVTLIQELQKSLKPGAANKYTEIELAPSKYSGKAEFFNERGIWDRLQKIGEWVFDDDTNVFTAEGVNKYLLSHLTYGDRPFEVKAHLKFDNLKPVDALAAVNAGIVFGFRSSGNTMRYYNLLLTGKRMLLELTGQRGGPVFQDFRHIDEGVDFPLIAGRFVDLHLRIFRNELKVLVGDQGIYSVAFEEDVRGRVGIRPWRSSIECDRFSISEIEEGANK